MKWEIGRYSWDELRGVGSAKHVPNALVSLCHSQDANSADVAYWNIDGHVMLSGALTESSLATAACAVIALPDCTPFGLSRMLELLVQIGMGFVSESEEAIGNSELKSRCLGELRKGFAFYLGRLGDTNIDVRLHCVDLAGLTAVDRSMKQQVIYYLNIYRSQYGTEGTGELIDNWISELMR